MLPATSVQPGSDLLYIKVARELAIEHYPLQTILDRYQIDPETWSRMKSDPRFDQVLRSEIEDWHSATNTKERTALKAAAMIEEWLPEANTRMYDRTENLPAKVELAKLITRVAGMGLNSAEVNGGSGEKFSVTINLGADQKLTFEKQVSPPKVIEGEVNV